MFTSGAAQGLSITVSSLVGAILRMTAIASLMNTTSLASFWMTKNQLQAFFLLLLTEAFILNDIQDVVQGSDFVLNCYEYIPLRDGISILLL